MCTVKEMELCCESEEDLTVIVGLFVEMCRREGKICLDNSEIMLGGEKQSGMKGDSNMFWSLCWMESKMEEINN